MTRVPGMRERQRGMRAIAAACALAGVWALSGCTALPEPYPEIPRDAAGGGQTSEELQDTLAQIDGLVVENASGSEPNAKGNTGFGFDLRLEPGYDVVDGPAFVDFLVESAWSVRDGYMPNTSVELRLFSNEGSDFLVGEAAIEAGWVPAGANVGEISPNGWSGATVWVETEGTRLEERGSTANRERLGEWPGDAPEVPEGVIARRDG
jgi:hypothetical protein